MVYMPSLVVRTIEEKICSNNSGVIVSVIFKSIDNLFYWAIFNRNLIILMHKTQKNPSCLEVCCLSTANCI